MHQQIADEYDRNQVATTALNIIVFAATILLASMQTAVAVESDVAALRDKADTLITEHFVVPSDTPGIALYVRNKRPRNQQPSPDNTVLFVHGATYPSETSFDLKLDGLSWMDYIAAHGWNVYLVDVRG